MKQIVLLFVLLATHASLATAQSWPFGFPKPVCSTMPPAATNCTKWPVVNNGRWDQGSTWNNGTIPGNNDIVCIPANTTVRIQGQTYSPEAPGQCQVNPVASPRLHVFLCGTIAFENSGKLHLGCGSMITIYTGGTVSAANGSSDLIQIGPTVVWGGPGSSNQPNLTGPYYVTGTGQGPGLLPAAISSFTATPEKPLGVMLKWFVTAEQNSKEYMVERSSDRQKWTLIGTVAAAGNQQSGLTYSMKDPRPAEGVNYYRLKQVDISGSYTYSNVVELKFYGAGQAVLFPNPVQQQATLYYPPGFKASNTIQVFNINGNLMKTITGVTGNYLNLSVSEMPAGSYIIKISEQGSTLNRISMVKN